MDPTGLDAQLYYFFYVGDFAFAFAYITPPRGGERHSGLFARLKQTE